MYIGYINYFWCEFFYVVVVCFCVVGGCVNARARELVLYFAIYLVYIKLFSGFSLDLP